MTNQDFASRTFVNAEGDEVGANGSPVGSLEEQVQRLNDVETLRQRVRDLTEENDGLKRQAEDATDQGDQRLLNENAELKTERDNLKRQAEVVAQNQSAAGDSIQTLTNQLASKTTEWNAEREALLKDTADSLQREDDLKTQVADLQGKLAAQGDGENAAPGDTDQRTRAELKLALDGKGVTYDANLKRDGLLALAAEHSA